MDTTTVSLLKQSFALLAPRAETLVDRFYEKLFSRHPQVRPLFSEDLKQQKQHLLAALTLVMQNLDRPENLDRPLRELGRRHVQYGAKPEHYPLVAAVLIDTMAELAGASWSPQFAAAWSIALQAIAGLMLQGASETITEAA